MQGFTNYFLGLLSCFMATPLVAQVEYSIYHYEEEFQNYGAAFTKIDANIKEQVALWVFPSETQDSKMSSTGDIEVVGHYQDGLAVVKYQNKYGFVNKHGQYIAAPEYQEVHWFSEGLAPVKYHEKWSFVNQKGEILTAFIYEYVGSFNLGLAVVQRDGKWGIINHKGIEIIVPQYDAIEIDKFGNISFLTGRTWRKWKNESPSN